MGSILDVLPHEGALFWGRSGAQPLPDGRFLLVTPGAAEVVNAAAGPPDNAVAAPDDSLPTRRPASMDAFPLFPGPPATSGESLGDAFRRLWPRRDEPDAYLQGDPYTGGLIRVAQALRGVREPLALSYRLAGGDPSDPEAAYQLQKAVQGLADAASMFQLPVLAGELTTNQELGLQVFAHELGPGLARTPPSDGDAIVLVGRMTDDLSGSLYLGAEAGFPPPIDLVVEGRVLEVVRGVGGGVPLGRGGLLLTLAGCCARARVGVRVTRPEGWRSLSPAAVLFGEAQSRFLVFLPAGRVPEVRQAAEPLGVPVAVLGTAGGVDLTVDGIVNLDVRDLQ